MIFPVIASICDNSTFSCTAGLCVVILGASIGVTTDLFLINRVLQYLPYFYIGWLLRKKVKKGVSKAFWHYWPFGRGEIYLSALPELFRAPQRGQGYF